MPKFTDIVLNNKLASMCGNPPKTLEEATGCKTIEEAENNYRKSQLEAWGVEEGK